MTISLPKSTEYWKPPGRATRGEANVEHIFVEVGRALSTWETTELVYSHLFSVFVGGMHGPNRAAQAAYGSIVSHGGRADALEQASRMFFGFPPHPKAKEFEPDWAELLKHFRDAAKVRNYIAHGMIHGYEVDGVPKGVFLEPPVYNTSKTDWLKTEMHEGTGTMHWRAKYRFVSSHIREYQQKFHALKREADRYYLDLMNATGGFEKLLPK